MGEQGSLWIVGSGLKAIADTSMEAVAQIRRADELFYLSADQVTTAWLHELNSSARSLGSSYAVGKLHRDIYAEMLERVLEPVRAGRRVCVALYGHPGVCAYAGHEAVRRAKAEGYPARMLPGISCEDSLFADLGVDPAASGLQTYEATNFLVRRRVFDPRAGLVLLQLGMLGQNHFKEKYSPVGVPLLVQVLSQAYGERHLVTLYEAALHSICGPLVEQVELAHLPQAPIKTATTLYVPPLPPEFDHEMVLRLDALFPD